MAKFRLVHTSFWNDPHVIEEMTGEDKYFFLYLLTNERTTQIGIYSITKKQIAFEIGYSMESVNALMQRFSDHHKLIKYNPETREIAIKNWGKYNLTRGGKPMLDCVKAELPEVKDISLIEYVSEGIPNESIKSVFESFYVTCNDTYNESSEENPSDGVKNNETLLNQGFHDTLDDTSTPRGEDKQQEQQQEEQQEEYKEQQQEASRVSSQSVNAIGQLAQFYESNIGILRPAVREELLYVLDTHKNAELILEALKRAVLNPQAHNKIRYAEGILNNWREQLITNVAQLQSKEATRNASNGQSNGRSGNNEYDGLSL